MIRQAFIAPERALGRLDAAGVFPRGWTSSEQGDGAVLPIVLSFQDVAGRVARRDEQWASGFIAGSADAVQVVWLVFVGAETNELRTLADLGGRIRRLQKLLRSALGHRALEVQHEVVLVDERETQPQVSDASLRRRVVEMHREALPRFRLYYMSGRLQALSVGVLESHAAWPIAVSNLLIGLRLRGDAKNFGAAADVYAWRAFAFRPWPADEEARLRAVLARKAQDQLESHGAGGEVAEPLRVRFRDELSSDSVARSGVVEETPASRFDPQRGDGVKPRGFRTASLLNQFLRDDPTADFAPSVREARQQSLQRDRNRRAAVWRAGWDLARSAPLGARQAIQILDANPLREEAAASERADEFLELTHRESALRKNEEDLRECGLDIEAAESARLGPATRLGVAVAVTGLLTYVVWSVFHQVLGQTVLAAEMVVAIVAGAGLTALISWLLEAHALDRAIKCFYNEGLYGLYRSRQNLVTGRGRLLRSATLEAIFGCEQAMKRELRTRLQRLSRLVEAGLGFDGPIQVQAVEAGAPGELEAREHFMPHLLDRPGSDQSVQSQSARLDALLEADLKKIRHAWARMVDAEVIDQIHSGRLVSNLRRTAHQLADQLFESTIDESRDHLLKALEARGQWQLAGEAFIEGLSVRAQGNAPEPMLWHALGRVAELPNWSHDVDAGRLLKHLGLVAFRLDLVLLKELAADAEGAQ